MTLTYYRFFFYLFRSINPDSLIFELIYINIIESPISYSPSNLIDRLFDTLLYHLSSLSSVRSSDCIEEAIIDPDSFLTPLPALTIESQPQWPREPRESINNSMSQFFLSLFFLSIEWSYQADYYREPCRISLQSQYYWLPRVPMWVSTMTPLTLLQIVQLFIPLSNRFSYPLLNRLSLSFFEQTLLNSRVDRFSRGNW